MSQIVEHAALIRQAFNVRLLLSVSLIAFSQFNFGFDQSAFSTTQEVSLSRLIREQLLTLLGFQFVDHVIPQRCYFTQLTSSTEPWTHLRRNSERIA